MCGAFYPNYFLKGPVDEESALREMSGNDPLNSVMVRKKYQTNMAGWLEDHAQNHMISHPQAAWI
jgi:hypothetical protein